MLIESICGSCDTEILGIFMRAHNDCFCSNAFYSRGSFFVFLSVAHPQDPHHPSEKPVIHCHKCGELCKGEVLRVQTKHFHIRCFTCKGMDPPASWLCAMSLPWRLPHPLNSTPVHQMVNECAPRPWNCSPSLIWEWIKLKGETELPPPPRPAVHCLWVFTEVPDPRRGA